MGRKGLTYLYVVSHPDGYLKIGRGDDPAERFSQIQIGSPYELTLEVAVKYSTPSAFGDAKEFESVVHSEFEEDHVRGEWFDVPLREVIHYLARCVELESSKAYSMYDIERESEMKERAKNLGVDYTGPL